MQGNRSVLPVLHRLLVPCHAQHRQDHAECDAVNERDGFCIARWRGIRILQGRGKLRHLRRGGKLRHLRRGGKLRHLRRGGKLRQCPVRHVLYDGVLPTPGLVKYVPVRITCDVYDLLPRDQAQLAAGLGKAVDYRKDVHALCVYHLLPDFYAQ